MIIKETENILKSFPSFIQLLSKIWHPHHEPKPTNTKDYEGIIHDTTGCLKTLWSFVILQSSTFHIFLTPSANLNDINEFLAQIFLAFLTMIAMTFIVYFAVFCLGRKKFTHLEKYNGWLPLFWATWAYTILTFSILSFFLTIIKHMKDASSISGLFSMPSFSPMENLQHVFGNLIDCNVLAIFIITSISVLLSMHFTKKPLKNSENKIYRPTFSILWPCGFLSFIILFSFLNLN